MEPFTQAELTFLQEVQSLARIATVGPDGTPHVTPVGWALSADQQAIEVGGRDLSRTKKFRDISRTGTAALVIDNVQPPWQPRGIEIRGRADAFTQPRTFIRIRPQRVIAWGFEGSAGARDVPSPADHTAELSDVVQPAAPGPKHAVVRRSAYDTAALAAGAPRMAQFERAHAAQPGYAGTVVVDVGEGERITVTLWDSEEHAAAARAALTPVVRELLGPMERTPSRILGVGRVISTDLSIATRPASRMTTPAK